MVRTVSKKPDEEFVSKRGRPTLARAEAIDNAILTTAREMFLTKGYAQTSMEALANLNGISKGTLYSRYADKTELFASIVADRMEVWKIENPVDPAIGIGDISDRLLNFGLVFLSQMRIPEVRAFDRLIAAEADRFPELSMNFFQKGHMVSVDQVTREIEAEGLRSGLRARDAEGLATAFISALIGWVRTMSLLRDVDDEQCSKFVARLVSLMVGGRPSW